MPSRGHALVRQMFQYASLGRDPTPYERDVEEVRSVTHVSYGITRNLALTLEVPFVYREDEGTSGGDGTGGGGGGGHHGGPPPTGGATDQRLTLYDAGFDDITLGFKWRVWQNDFGPIDTARFAVVGGVEIPTYEDTISSESFDPFVGGVFTYIRGRHGANAGLRWKFNTGNEDHLPTRAGHGPADAGFYDLSYLYRVLPSRYDGGSRAAAYAIVELNGVYETNGDHEVLVAPGIMYEARNFAIELSVQLPAWQDIEHRPKTEYTVTLGVRWLF